MTADLGSLRGHAGPCTLPLSGLNWALISLSPDVTASFRYRYLCLLIPSSLLYTSVTRTTPLNTLSLDFSFTTKTAHFQ